MSCKSCLRPASLRLRRVFSACMLLTSLSVCGETMPVSGAASLAEALAAAKPGDAIELADGDYTGIFRISRSGTHAQPIRFTGSMRAILRHPDREAGYGLHLDHADYWILEGFTVADAGKGIMLDGASHNILRRLHIHDIGAEGVHFRAFSSHNVLEHSIIRDTGKIQPGFGEAVYIGSAQSNWTRHSGGMPDRSDHNHVLFNRIGPGVRAEGIDIKEGTSGGLIRGNLFDGAGISGRNYADSMIDVKGNDYFIEENRFASSDGGNGQPLDAIQVHRVRDGWGRNNLFRANRFELAEEGVGIRVQKGAQGNRVCASNTMTDANAGHRLTNLTIQAGC